MPGQDNSVCESNTSKAEMFSEIRMTPLMIAALGLLMVATAFLSGLFGMAGGLILIGVLLTILPLPSAMALHAITQMPPTAGGRFCGGATSRGGRFCAVFSVARFRLGLGRSPPPCPALRY